jgi:hypothetical protein
MTWSDNNGGSNKKIPRITKVRTLYPGGQSKNPAVPEVRKKWLGFNPLQLFYKSKPTQIVSFFKY